MRRFEAELEYARTGLWRWTLYEHTQDQRDRFIHKGAAGTRIGAIWAAKRAKRRYVRTGKPGSLRRVTI